MAGWLSRAVRTWNLFRSRAKQSRAWRRRRRAEEEAAAGRGDRATRCRGGCAWAAATPCAPRSGCTGGHLSSPGSSAPPALPYTVRSFTPRLLSRFPLLGCYSDFASSPFVSCNCKHMFSLPLCVADTFAPCARSSRRKVGPEIFYYFHHRRQDSVYQLAPKWPNYRVKLHNRVVNSQEGEDRVVDRDLVVNLASPT